MVKVIAVILAVIIILMAGYMVVDTVIGVLNGKSVTDAADHAWHQITTLFGLIKEQTHSIEFPMANSRITWTYTKASYPR